MTLPLPANTVFMPEYDEIRDLLIQARERAGLTQRSLGAKVGRSASHIALIEAGQRKLDVLEFYFIAEAMDLDPATTLGELFGRIARRRAEVTAAPA
jgi:transcriptional regulator with XRE-family HTH domain